MPLVGHDLKVELGTQELFFFPFFSARNFLFIYFSVPLEKNRKQKWKTVVLLVQEKGTATAFIGNRRIMVKQSVYCDDNHNASSSWAC